MFFENKTPCFRAVSNSADTYPKTEEEKEFERGYQDYMKEYEKTAYQRGRDQAARDVERSRLIEESVKGWDYFL